MNKKEVLEIRKQFTPERNVITRICGCYIDGEKNILLKSKEAFNSLSEEDSFKYFDIFKHTLSGTLGKNLMNMEFPLSQEVEGGTQEFLLRLRDSKLLDDTLIDEFYDKIIANYDYNLNYYIILIHSIYDVPGKSTDGTEMFDASDSVYDYIMCSICPVSLSKPGLSYDAEACKISERIRDWVVEAPSKGFLFPVFTDRTTDIHGVMYYSKNPEELQPALIENVLGSTTPMTAVSQKETFNTIIAETLGDDINYDTVMNIHDTLNEMIEEHKDIPEPLILTKSDVKKIFEKSEVPEEKMKSFDREFVEIAGDNAALLATNIASTKKYNIETPNIVIKVNPEYSGLIETKIIDGRQCLVIAVDDHIEVNGVSIGGTSSNEENNEDFEDIEDIEN